MKIEELLDQCSEALVEFDGLCITKCDDFPIVLEGQFLVETPLGSLDGYDVRLEFSEDFPSLCPKVLETGGRIPYDIDRHVFADGSACLEVWSLWFLKNPSATVLSVLKGPIRNFFLSQSIFEAERYWPLGEYSHGNLGRLEAMADFLGAKSLEMPELIWRALSLIDPPKRQNECPCGSRELYRKCHRTEIDEKRASLHPNFSNQMTSILLDLIEWQKKSSCSSEPESVTE